MIRVLIFFALLFAVTAGFAWLADLPGVISISWQGYVWEQPPVIVAVMSGFALLIVLLAVWLVISIVRSPKIASRFFKRRRKDRGFDALSSGLIALGAGDAKLARRHGLDAERLLKDEPAPKLLLAQTAQLAGRDEEARTRFEDMLDDKRTRALGLHGLFIEAERQQEPVAARHYAEEAAKEQPGLEWAGKAVLGYQAVASHWDNALKTLERNYAAKMLDKKTYRRHRAVILTALAQQLEEREPDRAFSLAKEAHGLALDLVPAAVVAARLATRKGEIRKASKLIEGTWRVAPHPELAEAYAHVRSGDSAVDRLKRVKTLAGLRANTIIGGLAVARAALDAREFAEARDQLKSVLRAEPVRGAFLMMAELEEAEHGDKGRMRDWLARAVKAPLDKAWIADGVVSREWQAVSPLTGKLDAFEWRTPSGFDEEPEGEVIEDSLFEAPALPTLPADGDSDGTELAGQNEVIDTVQTKAGEPATDLPPADELAANDAKTGPDDHPTAVVSQPETPVKTEASSPGTAPATPQGYEGTTDDVKHMTRPHDLAEASPAPTSDRAARQEAEKAASSSKEGSENGNSTAQSSASAKSELKKTEDKKDLDKPIALPFARMPDDPGTDEEEEQVKPVRPRFFN